MTQLKPCSEVYKLSLLFLSTQFDGPATANANGKCRSRAKIAADTYGLIVQFTSILSKYAVGTKYFSSIANKKRQVACCSLVCVRISSFTTGKDRELLGKAMKPGLYVRLSERAKKTKY